MMHQHHYYYLVTTHDRWNKIYQKILGRWREWASTLHWLISYMFSDVFVITSVVHSLLLCRIWKWKHSIDTNKRRVKNSLVKFVCDDSDDAIWQNAIWCASKVQWIEKRVRKKSRYFYKMDVQLTLVGPSYK